jgi:hypothetical protein
MAYCPECGKHTPGCAGVDDEWSCIHCGYDGTEPEAQYGGVYGFAEWLEKQAVRPADGEEA